MCGSISPGMLRHILCCIAASTLFSAAIAESAHSYKQYDNVPVIANKIGPFNNPVETYKYYSLPFCKPNSHEEQDHDFGELLSGSRKVNTPYDIRFLASKEWDVVCDPIKYEQDEIALFLEAIEDDYYFEFLIDDLPMHGYIGFSSDEDLILGRTAQSKVFMYTHLHFMIEYNGPHIVAANVSGVLDHAVELTGGHKAINVQWSYSVEFIQSDLQHQNRLSRYDNTRFLPTSEEIHWVSIVNSLVLVVLLLVALSIIMVRVVKNDFTKALREEEGMGADEETGWKLVANDAFRPPPFRSLFAALVGNGVQFLLLGLALLVFSSMGAFHHHKQGSMMSGALVLYCLTSVIGSFCGARLYRQLGGKDWVWNVVLVAVIYPVPLLASFAFLNTTAIAHASTAALPFGTIVLLFALFLFVGFPLTVLGGIAGHRSNAYKVPIRPRRVRIVDLLDVPPTDVGQVPRQIPEVPFYKSWIVQIFVGGLLPFAAISVELHYIVASIWGHQVYTLYGIILISAVLLTIVTATLVVALTYYQLVSEDHKWWWRSFFSGGSVGFFIYAYCFWFYTQHSSMNGFLQSSFFFGYMLNASFAAFLTFGSVGFYSAYFFVHFIYKSLKSE